MRTRNHTLQEITRTRSSRRALREQEPLRPKATDTGESDDTGRQIHVPIRRSIHIHIGSPTSIEPSEPPRRARSSVGTTRTHAHNSKDVHDE